MANEFRFNANREVRIVPAGWQHPVDERDRPAPLLPGHMPKVGDQTAIAAYETTSEGTPISPAFPDTPEGRLELVRYCASYCSTFGAHRADEEAWAAILFGDGAVVTESGVVEA